MAFYNCKVDGCAGLVGFGEKNKGQNKNLSGYPKRNRGFAMILAVKDKPVECPVCHKSYYEWELK